jgi:hypothetical protein
MGSTACSKKKKKNHNIIDNSGFHKRGLWKGKVGSAVARVIRGQLFFLSFFLSFFFCSTGVLNSGLLLETLCQP